MKYWEISKRQCSPSVLQESGAPEMWFNNKHQFTSTHGLHDPKSKVYQCVQAARIVVINIGGCVA